MDAIRFDHFARAAAGAGRSRRGLVRQIVIAIVAAATLPVGGAPVTAACRRAGARCHRNAKCCGGSRCLRGRCACLVGWADCDGTGVCTSLQTTINCGGCGQDCVGDEGCCSGVCVDPQDPLIACEPCSVSRTGMMCCSGVWVNSDGNDAHCGTCNRACAEGTACCGRDCFDLATSTSHCGGCGNLCRFGQSCIEGTCVYLCTFPRQTCRVDQECCQFLEGDATSRCDDNGCNGRACCRTWQQACQGDCDCCPEAATCCADRCTDVMNDRDHCGECGRACGADERCVAGSCVAGACKELTDRCAEDAECCQTAGATVCRGPNFFTAAPTCCRELGQACLWIWDCCQVAPEGYSNACYFGRCVQFESGPGGGG